MKNIVLILAAALVFASCKKKVDDLPPATQTGANTFGAKIDGSFFIPQGFGPFAGNILEARWMPGRDLIINARNFASSPNEKEFEIFLKNVVTPGIYQLNTATSGYPNVSASYAYYVKRNITPENEWVTNAQYTGSVTITKADTINNIVSGTFQFNMINKYNNPQPLSVTEGRFDILIE